MVDAPQDASGRIVHVPVAFFVRPAKTDGGLELVLAADGDAHIYAEQILGSVTSTESAVALIYDALTAPLADAEKLKTLDELSTQVQTMVDELGGVLNRLTLLEEQVRGVDVLTELARLATALSQGHLGTVPAERPTLRTREAAQRQPQIPPGPDRGLRRPAIPHQPSGGAVHRGEAVAEHGEG